MNKYSRVCALVVSIIFLSATAWGSLRYSSFYENPSTDDLTEMSDTLQKAVKLINEFEGKLQELESKIEDLDSKVGSYASPYDSLDSRIDSLKSELSDIESRVSYLE